MKIIFTFIIITLMCSCDEHPVPIWEKIDSLIVKSDNETNIQRRFRYLDSAYTNLKTVPTDSLKTKYLFKLANRNWNEGNLSRFYFFTSESLKAANQCDSQLFRAKAFLYLGDYYSNILEKRRDSAQIYFLKARQIYQKKNQDDMIALCDYKLAKQFFSIGDLGNAEIGSLRAYNFFKNSVDIEAQYNCLILLGVIANELKDYNRAIEFLMKALEICDANGLSILQRAIAKNNLGKTFLDSGNILDAKKYFESAYSTDNLYIIDAELYAIVIENLAQVYQKLNYPSNLCEKFFYKSIYLNDLIKTDQVTCRVNLSKFCFSTNRKYEALEISRQAANLAYASKNSQLKINALNNLVELNFDTDNDVNELLKEMRLVNDKEKKLRSEFARIKFDTWEIINEKNLAIRQKWIWFVSFLILLTLVGLVFIIAKQRVKSKNLEIVAEREKSDRKIYNLLIAQTNKDGKVRRAENERIARDLHDGIMNKLTSIRINLFKLQDISNNKIVDQCLPYVEQIQEVEKEIRYITKNVLELSSHEGNFHSLLWELVFEVKKISSANIFAEIDECIPWENISNKTKINLYRILQEALLNAIKYSSASKISIKIKDGKDSIYISVGDDGCGFNLKTAKKGSGLKNIRFRIKEMHGSYRIKSTFNRGTLLEFNIYK